MKNVTMKNKKNFTFVAYTLCWEVYFSTAWAERGDIVFYEVQTDHGILMQSYQATRAGIDVGNGYVVALVEDEKIGQSIKKLTKFDFLNGENERHLMFLLLGRQATYAPEMVVQRAEEYLHASTFFCSDQHFAMFCKTGQNISWQDNFEEAVYDQFLFPIEIGFFGETSTVFSKVFGLGMAVKEALSKLYNF